jgi:hypothetical protein
LKSVFRPGLVRRLLFQYNLRLENRDPSAVARLVAQFRTDYPSVWIFPWHWHRPSQCRLGPAGRRARFRRRAPFRVRRHLLSPSPHTRPAAQAAAAHWQAPLAAGSGSANATFAPAPRSLSDSRLPVHSIQVLSPLAALQDSYASSSRARPPGACRGRSGPGPGSHHSGSVTRTRTAGPGPGLGPAWTRTVTPTQIMSHDHDTLGSRPSEPETLASSDGGRRGTEPLGSD